MLTLWLAATDAQGQFVTNGTFSDPNNDGVEGSVLFDYDEEIGNGPWRGRGDSVLALLAPTTSIGFGFATISGLTDVGLGPFVNNSAEIYLPDIGASLPSNTFVQGWRYTISAEIFRVDGLDVDLLTDSGVGIGFLGNGAEISGANSLEGFDVDIDVIDADRLRVTLDYVATLSDAGDTIGVRLFAGEGSGIDLSLLSAVSFDNVTISAVPEPGSLAMAGAALLGLGGVFWRRRRSKNQQTNSPQTPATA